MRITAKTLEARINYLNRLMDRPATPWTKENGLPKSNIGNFHLYQAYGGYNVHEICNESGGVRTPISYGCIPGRDLYEKINSFIDGLEYGERNQ